MQRIEPTKAELLREVIGKVVAALAEREIRVTQVGLQPCVEFDREGRPTVVNIPCISDESSDELIEVIRGFVDHEVAHVLFTDFTKTLAFKRKILKSTVYGAHVDLAMFHLNVVEDIAIERQSRRKFPGVTKNLKFAAHAMSGLLGKNINKRRADGLPINNSLIVPVMRHLGGDDNMLDPLRELGVDAEVEQIANFYGEFKSRLLTVDSTKEAIEITLDIMDKLIAEQEQEESGESDESDKSDDSESDKSDDSGSGDSDKSDDSESGESGESDESDKSDDSESDKSDDSGSDDSESGDSDKSDDSGSDKSDDSGSDDSGSGDSDDSGSGESGDSAGAGLAKDILESDLSEVDGDSGRALEDAIKDLIQGGTSSRGYLDCFSRDLDRTVRVETLPPGFDVERDRHVRCLESEVRKTSPLVQQELKRLLKAKEKKVWRTRRRRGRLHTGAFSRLARGQVDVFRDRIEKDAVNISIQLVVDLSGSMRAHGGKKISMAILTAAVFAEVLSHINIDFSIGGFTTAGWNSVWQPSQDCVDPRELDEFVNRYFNSGQEFDRISPFLNIILKDWDERYDTKVKTVLAAMKSPDSTAVNASNVDGPSIDSFARGLFKRKSKRKIMIVMSDGKPVDVDPDATEGQLCEVLQRIQASGIETFGIGMMSSCVQKFYENSAVIHDMSELPELVLGKLKDFLI